MGAESRLDRDGGCSCGGGVLGSWEMDNCDGNFGGFVLWWRRGSVIIVESVGDGGGGGGREVEFARRFHGYG